MHYFSQKIWAYPVLLKSWHYCLISEIVNIRRWLFWRHLTGQQNVGRASLRFGTRKRIKVAKETHLQLFCRNMHGRKTIHVKFGGFFLQTQMKDKISSICGSSGRIICLHFARNSRRLRGTPVFQALSGW